MYETIIQNIKWHCQTQLFYGPLKKKSHQLNYDMQPDFRDIKIWKNEHFRDTEYGTSYYFNIFNTKL